MIGWREVIRRRFWPRVRSPSARSTGLYRPAGRPGGRGSSCSCRRSRSSMPTASDQAGMARRYRRSGGVAPQVRRLQDDGGPCQGGPRCQIRRHEVRQTEQHCRTNAIAAAQPPRMAICCRRAATPGGHRPYRRMRAARLKADEKQREKVQEDLRAKEFEMLAKRHLRDIRQDAHIEFAMRRGERWDPRAGAGRASGGYPPLAVTMGDPAGIGPDITLASWLERTSLELPPFVLLWRSGRCSRERALTAWPRRANRTRCRRRGGAGDVRASLATSCPCARVGGDKAIDRCRHRGGNGGRAASDVPWAW